MMTHLHIRLWLINILFLNVFALCTCQKRDAVPIREQAAFVGQPSAIDRLSVTNQ